LTTAVQLANRASADKKDYYKKYAMAQWGWFKNSTLINSNNMVCDSLNNDPKNPTCETGGNKCTTFTYTQGVILNALVELDNLEPDPSYLKIASQIANASINRKTVGGILVEAGGQPDATGAQFKGAFARGLMILHHKQPEDNFVNFFQANADSIWSRARNTTDGHLGPLWQGPFSDEASTLKAGSDMAGHNSAINCILGAHIALRT
jgi:predicted alpha-1,6-mannanase (GH76 family)